MGNKAEELQGTYARVAELVKLVGRDENARASPQRMLPVALQDRADAFEHEDLVLVGVAVLGRLAAGGHLEQSHGEPGRSVLLADQAAEATSDGPVRVDRSGFDFLIVRYFHGLLPRCIVERSAVTFNQRGEPYFRAVKNPEATTPSAVFASAKETSQPSSSRSTSRTDK
jgi:hypothetical protein